jgi:hypothetical protein
MKRDETMETRTTSEKHLVMDFDERKLYDDGFGDDLDLEFQSK